MKFLVLFAAAAAALTTALPSAAQFAKPEDAKFRAGATKMQDEASKLNAAAKGGNLEQIKAAFGETAKTCKGCHDTFRAQ